MLKNTLIILLPSRIPSEPNQSCVQDALVPALERLALVRLVRVCPCLYAASAALELIHLHLPAA